MPAKLKLTHKLVGEIVELKRDGLCDADIIAAIGVHPSTFYRWLKEGEDARTGVKRALYEELKKAEAQYKRGLLTTIKDAAMSRAQYWTAAAWLLERKYPMEYGKMERKAEDSDNAPVQLTLGLVIEPMVSDGDGE
ncbi:MAG: helix-turn-helix domain-containing protein [Olsenella sp.]|nr:helix-turn-helix domain-containing protein [Olsenella sp.]